MQGDGRPPSETARQRRRRLLSWAAWLGLVLAGLMVLLPVPGQLEDPDGEPVLAACGSVIAPAEHGEATWATEACADVRRPLRDSALTLVAAAIGIGVLLRRGRWNDLDDPPADG